MNVVKLLEIKRNTKSIYFPNKQQLHSMDSSIISNLLKRIEDLRSPDLGLNVGKKLNKLHEILNSGRVEINFEEIATDLDVLEETSNLLSLLRRKDIEIEETRNLIRIKEKEISNVNDSLDDPFEFSKKLPPNSIVHHFPDLYNLSTECLDAISNHVSLFSSISNKKETSWSINSPNSVHYLWRQILLELRRDAYPSSARENLRIVYEWPIRHSNSSVGPRLDFTLIDSRRSFVDYLGFAGGLELKKPKGYVVPVILIE